MGHRVRQAWRKGARVSAINPLDWAFTFETSLERDHTFEVRILRYF